ncbi:MAG: hypothetical protein AAB758_03025, partial [Patescibacteria group bacterium]
MAEVVVARVIRTSLKVEDAVEIKPFRKASVVEVACSPVESLVNGKEAVSALAQEVLQSWDIHKVVKSPRVAKKFVVVADVPVAFW